MISPLIENMPRTPQKGGNVRLPEETIKMLRKLVKHKPNETQATILTTLIKMAEVHDLLNEDWQERLTAALEKGMWHLERKRHLNSKEKCAGLRDADLKWKCIQGRKDMTPLIRFLAEGYDDALNLCEGCTVTLDPILKNYELQEKIRELEESLDVAAGVTFKAPVCNRGAILTADGTEFKGCERGAGRQHETVSILKWCKVYENKLPCYSYAEIPIVADRKSKVDMKL